MIAGVFRRFIASSKSYWLLLIVLVFSISAGFGLYQLNQSIDILNKRYGTSVWSLFQLKSELRRFTDTIVMFEYGGASADELHDRYDILWSRFTVLLEGIDAEQLEKVDGAIEMISGVFEEVKEVEDLVFSLKPEDRELAETIRQRFEPYQVAVERLALGNYHFNNDFYNRGDKSVARLQQQLIYLMIGLMLSGGVLFLMVLRESRNNRFQALHDSLTGMPNRAFLREELVEACTYNTPFALHLLDLNGFKDVNDTLGHHCGDVLLQQVAWRLVEVLKQSRNVLVCRLGGDEFAIVQQGLEGREAAELAAQRIIEALDEEFIIDGHSCFVGASIGITLYPQHAKEVSTLLSHADLAMYRAKARSPESAYCFFRAEMDDAVKRRQQLFRDLREALELNQLELAYQPIVDLETGEVCYLEALLRWQHPQIGYIPPMEIVGIAEQYALAHQLGEWVIRQACRQSRLWQSDGASLVPISVNISPSLYRFDLVNVISEALATEGLPTYAISIEVTEDTTMQVITDAKDMLPRLHAMGISIALDDFGTGLSSLSHLQELSMQTLKIDRSFIQGMCKKESDCTLVSNIIGIGHDLGMKVVAEGIEEENVAQLLRYCGCDMGQGYLFSKPVPASCIPDVYQRLGVKYSLDGDPSDYQAAAS